MIKTKSSKFKKFYQKTHDERLSLLQAFSNLNNKEISLLKKMSLIDFNSANRMIENVISTFQMPLGIATNFLINNKNYLIPMAIEEPSVVAAASNAAKLAKYKNGFTATSSEPRMIGQIQINKVPDIEFAKKEILKNKNQILELANKCDSILINLGGGAIDIITRIIKTVKEKFLVIHLIVNVKDAMGANIINTMLEKISPLVEKITKGKTLLKIVSNLSTLRITKAKAIWSKKKIGEKVIGNIINAYHFALVDPFRCVTHNKGIMNGIDAVCIATGNDFRALEAGAHAFASLNSIYKPLTKYYKNKTGDLVGEIKLPLSAGIVGGITQTHLTAKINLKILKVKTAIELCNIMACVGLAQNFAALKELVTKGIQTGHMKLHSKNIAIMAGAKKEKIDLIAEQMINEKNICISRAKELIACKNYKAHVGVKDDK